MQCEEEMEGGAPLGQLRDYFVEGLKHCVNFETSTPCPKLPARILLDDLARMISLNIKEGDCDCYTMEPYDISHHIDITPGQDNESRGILKDDCQYAGGCSICPDNLACE